MLSLPLSLVGVAGLLFLAKDTMNIMSIAISGEDYLRLIGR
jgi:hypothetical protein